MTRRRGIGHSALAAAFMLLFAAIAMPAAHAAGTTVISLTFDDGDADQLNAAKLLERHDMHGTFYIATGAVGQPGYLTRAQLGKLANAGNELGAHTVSHLNLNKISAAEARRQACGSRAQLHRWGFRASSLAYPNAATNSSVERVVRACGFRSARLGAHLRGRDCSKCAPAEAIPPKHPYAIRTPGAVDSSWTLADLKDVVTTAERHGGWVPLVFHHVCRDGCGSLSVTPSVLGQFLSWLAQRQGNGTTVRTVSQVAGRTDKPVVSAPPARAHRLQNPSVESYSDPAGVDLATEEPDDTAAPSCWKRGGYGNNNARWRRTSHAHSGRSAERVDITSYTDGDAKLLQRFDLGECSLPVRSGHSYRLGTWYHSSTRTQFAVYVRGASGAWRYWISSPFFGKTQDWKHAQWRTPPVPAHVHDISFGLALFSRGSLTTDDYSFTPDTDSGPAIDSTATAEQSGYGMQLGAGLGLGAAVLVVAGLLFGNRRWNNKRNRTGN